MGDRKSSPPLLGHTENLNAMGIDGYYHDLRCFLDEDRTDLSGLVMFSVPLAAEGKYPSGTRTARRQRKSISTSGSSPRFPPPWFHAVPPERGRARTTALASRMLVSTTFRGSLLAGLLQRFDQEEDFGSHRVVQSRGVGEGEVATAGNDRLEGLDEGAKRSG